MSKEKSPAFQFFPRDLLSDLNYQMMNYPERGMYWHLVSLCWLEMSIPSDLGSLARILHVKPEDLEEPWKVIGKCFIADPCDCYRLLHPRLELERKIQSENRKKKSIAGRKSAEIRWAKHKKRKAKVTTAFFGINRTVTESNSSSASAITPPIVPQGTVVYSEAFERFWKVYPKKIGKQPSWKTWIKINPQNGLAEKIIQSVLAHKETDQWLKEDGQFIPNPQTYLNQARWEDEIATHGRARKVTFDSAGNMLFER